MTFGGLQPLTCPALSSWGLQGVCSVTHRTPRPRPAGSTCSLLPVSPVIHLSVPALPRLGLDSQSHPLCTSLRSPIFPGSLTARRSVVKSSSGSRTKNFSCQSLGFLTCNMTRRLPALLAEGHSGFVSLRSLEPGGMKDATVSFCASYPHPSPLHKSCPFSS